MHIFCVAILFSLIDVGPVAIGLDYQFLIPCWCTIYALVHNVQLGSLALVQYLYSIVLFCYTQEYKGWLSSDTVPLIVP